MTDFREIPAKEIQRGDVVLDEHGKKLNIIKVSRSGMAYGAGMLQLSHDGQPDWTIVHDDDLLQVNKLTND